MAQQPAVIFIARHGPRLDAADSSWFLSTPTPYDPPITYGGWNQSRSLGTRIASLLHAREQEFEAREEKVSDLENKDEDGQDRPRKRRRLKHKVAIHSSPFLRCLQTSIAIAAGMAQYNPTIETDGKQKRPSSASPRMRVTEGTGNPRALSSIAEPKYDFAHAIARKALYERKRYRKSKVRVDAFLGEWLNPQYFEGITAPPPSAMMVTTAKAELMENETVEVYRPTVVTKPTAGSSLWAGANGARPGSRESPLDDWSPIEEAMPPISPTRSRANTENSPIANDSGRKSPFRPGSPLQPLASLLPKHETSTYRPPTPQYAVSASHQIPRGYVTHARNACTNVDYGWDSSRAPLLWGDGGEYGEEWSQMHKRIRKGLSCLITYYGQEGTEEMSEDVLGFQDAESEEEEEQDELVVILVTHGAGCNALMGALTGQPVLLDVGMASLTMAVRREDVPPIAASPTARRRGSLDPGLSAAYEMKFVASTEHLRPGRAGSPSGRTDSGVSRDALPRFRERPEPSSRTNTNSSLGTIRRPSATPAVPTAANDGARKNSESPSFLPLTQPVSVGLWTPPAGTRSPALQPQTSAPATQQRGSLSTGESMELDSNSAASLPPLSSTGSRAQPTSAPTGNDVNVGPSSNDTAYDSDEFMEAGDTIPAELSRRMSQQGLWGSRPSGARVARMVRQPKRRWTVEQD